MTVTTAASPVTKYVLVTRREVMEILKCGNSKYYELIGSRRLKSVKQGRSRRVRSDHLQEYLDSLTDNDAKQADQ